MSTHHLLGQARSTTTSIWADFKAFIAQGSVIDLGVGIVIGAAFSGIVTSFVDDIITPPIGLVVGGRDLENMFWVIKKGKSHAGYKTIEEAHADGAVTINGGRFAMAGINFIIISFMLFWFVRLAMAFRRSHKEEEVADSPPERRCDECMETIHPEARRCKFCTAVVQDHGERGTSGNLIQT
ncbi:large conductance mechanosensitive channel protein [Syncephalis fuscata]|nr:large conductance mechanosensitive channel protein [Syncephalis fuscata]